MVGKGKIMGFGQKKMTTKDASNKDTRELVPFSYRFNDDFDEDEKKEEKRLTITSKRSVVFYKIDYMRKRFRMLSL